MQTHHPLEDSLFLSTAPPPPLHARQPTWELLRGQGPCLCASLSEGSPSCWAVLFLSRGSPPGTATALLSALPHRRARTESRASLLLSWGERPVGPSLYRSPVFATLAAALAYSPGLRPKSQGHVRRRSLTSVGQRHCPSLSGPALAGQGARGRLPLCSLVTARSVD